jgi:nicotinamide riboside kinase
MMQKVINLFGGPGSGKSTIAAGLFYRLKMSGCSCEYVTEYAKDLVWSSNYETLSNQIYVFGKQHNKMFRLRNKVDYIITDSPLLLSIYYAIANNFKSTSLKNLILEEHDKYDNINIFLNRVKQYDESGRTQTLQQAKDIDWEIENNLLRFLEKYYYIVDGDEKAVDIIYDIIFK